MLSHLYLWLRCKLSREEGQDLIEYALLVAFIAVVALVGVEAAGEGVSDLFEAVGGWVGGVTMPE